VARDDVGIVAAQVQVGLLAGVVVEHQGLAAARGHGAFHCQRHVGKLSGGKNAVAFEGGVVRGRSGRHDVGFRFV
jgi:hypothetical protein